MYHETTYEDLRARKARRIRRAVVLVVVAACLWLAISYANDLAHEQGAAALRDSVMRSALQCCAVEGSFPTSIEHLEEHYGLVINEHDYRVMYEWMGDNVAPSVVVKPL